MLDGRAKSILRENEVPTDRGLDAWGVRNALDDMLLVVVCARPTQEATS